MSNTTTSPSGAEPIRGETALVQEFLAPLAAGYPGAHGLRDDCAAISPTPGHDLVVKTDPIAAGVHFFDDDPPADIGWKALAVNVSDLIAKGAVPRAYLMALSFPEAPTRDWLAQFASGLAEAQLAYGVHLVGGDTDRRPGPVTISITVIGEVPAGRMIRRGTAQPGDHICVSGMIGEAALGLALHKGEISGFKLGLHHHEAWRLVDCYLRPRPDPELIPILRQHARAAMDISDGLAKDLGRMCRASGVGAIVEAERIPISAAAATIFSGRPDLRLPCLTGGDDYKVLFAVPPECVDAVLAATDRGLSSIGVFTSAPEVRFRDGQGQDIPLDRTGYDHF